MHTSNGLVVLTREECLKLLAVTPIGRIVFSHRAMPAVEPVNFLVEGETIVIRTGPGSKLSAASQHAVVAFQIDEIDIDRHEGWSVTAVGQAEQVREPVECERLDRLPLRPWAPGVHEHFIKIPIELISGRRLVDLPRAAPDAFAGVPPAVGHR